MKKKRIAKTADIDFDWRMNQEQFAALLGLSQQEVSKMVRFGVLSPDGTAKEWIRQWRQFMLGQIYARKGWKGLAEISGE